MKIINSRRAGRRLWPSAFLFVTCLLLLAASQATAQVATPDAPNAKPIATAQAAPEINGSEDNSPAPDPAATPTTSEIAAPATLPRDLSPWGMYLHADWVVKAVLIGLAIASVVNLTVLLAKSFELLVVQRRQRLALDTVSRAHTLDEARQQLGRGSGGRSAGAELIAVATDELKLSADSLDDREGLKERIAARLVRLEAAHSRRISYGTGVLATIGGTAPFVGLFGTVWGIMRSFIGISEAQTTNLAVIAPGIAEALLATAMGLVAAIPAVIIYNYFARRIAGYRALVGDISAAVLGLVSRDLSRGVIARPHADATAG